MNSVINMLLPLLFVTLYGSGFVGAKLGLPYAEPFTFLSLRFLLAAAILAIIAFMLRRRWNSNPFWLIISSLLLQGVFSVGVFYALYMGMSPSLSALIIALQPILVAVFSPLIVSETVSKKSWLGLVIGVVGVAVVVIDGLSTDSVTWTNLSWAVIGLFGLSLGQLVQKRFCADMDLITGGALQAFAVGIAMAAFAFLFESTNIHWNHEFIIALLWMAIGVSVGALSLLYLMIRYQSATQVASIFYGVPVAAALVAWPLFGQTPTMVDWVGFTIVATAVMLVNRSPKQPKGKKATTDHSNCNA